MAAAAQHCPTSKIEVDGGCAAWRVLEWDTEQFGVCAARLDRLEASGPYSQSRAVQRSLLQAVLTQCDQAGVRHVTARVDAGDLACAHALEESGFELIDAIQTFSLALDGGQQEVVDGVRLFTPEDLSAVVEIGRTSFVYDRFHADAGLEAGVADRVNEAWTRNCCLGTAADAVVVAEEEGRVASFVTCRLDVGLRRGTIILVATADWARGRGAARRATLGSLRWFATQGMETVEVGTQLRNIPAGRLYEGLGFRLSSASLTFRKLL